jgi:DNA-binding response OmpR family regulator
MTAPAVARQTVLIVDDEEGIRSALQTLLRRGGFDVISAADGRAAMVAVQMHTPDLVLLDVVLDESAPNHMGGIEVLKAIRAMDKFVPVIMLTSYAEWQLESLGQGALAFITKPWDTNALLGQIRATLNAIAHVRRETANSGKNVPADSTSNVLRIANIEIHLLHFRVYQAGQEIDLTPLEFALLAFLARYPNQEWTREALLNAVWGYEWAGYPRTVDRHVAALRRKLHLERDNLIETLHGTGYRLNLPNHNA